MSCAKEAPSSGRAQLPPIDASTKLTGKETPAVATNVRNDWDNIALVVTGSRIPAQ